MFPIKEKKGSQFSTGPEFSITTHTHVQPSLKRNIKGHTLTVNCFSFSARATPVCVQQLQLAETEKQVTVNREEKRRVPLVVISRRMMIHSSTDTCILCSFSHFLCFLYCCCLVDLCSNSTVYSIFYYVSLTPFFVCVSVFVLVSILLRFLFPRIARIITHTIIVSVMIVCHSSLLQRRRLQPTI